MMMSAMIIGSILGCKSEADEPAAETKEVKPASANVELLYDFGHPAVGYWQEGDVNEVAMVLNSLKAWENGNTDSCLTAFGDSIRWVSDNFDKKMSHDSFKTFMNDYRSSLKSVTVKMDDVVHVVNKDGTQNWVTMWYKQYNTDMKGHVDSLNCIDDLKIEKGKIVLVDGKTNRIPAK